MKKIFSFLTLSIFLVIGFFHNFMEVFSMHNNMEMKMENTICCTDNDNDKCNHSCCINSSIDLNILFINNNDFKKKILKDFINVHFSDLNKFNLYGFNTKNLLTKTRPPYFKVNINNYSYCQLIKIIKANT